ncbi:hypothetical protein [Cupriavidus sp. D384]|uniref:hypothetical protein n=1 Tax=Cupriavidus sp. D384 TaxID=1538095 RepID=UPI000B32AC64|nr:hypothetical protein [Cupriavidus sp. D384]
MFQRWWRAVEVLGPASSCGLSRHSRIQSIFRAGKPHERSAIALSRALEKLEQLVAIAAQDDLPMGAGEQSI